MNNTIKTNSKILLTGAGFTHNFGTPLSRELWAIIFNHESIQSNLRVKDLMLKDFDYESIYYTIMEGSFTDSEKEAINDATLFAYRYLDSIIRDYRFTTNAPYPVNIYKVQKLIDLFSGTRSEKGIFFTLNQDLFVERKYYNGQKPTLPGIQNRSDWFSTNFNRELADNDYCKLPSKEELESVELSLSKFLYIKLHGSYNWHSSIRPHQMVIGKGKAKQIQEEPILSWYFNLFKTVLSQTNSRMLIIGYGFGDDHINEVIAKSIKDYGFKIYIVSPTSPEQFQKNLFKLSYGKDIWIGLNEYYPHKLVELFPGDQSETQAWLNLRESFFH